MAQPYPLDFTTISEQTQFPTDDEAIDALEQSGYDAHSYQRDVRNLPPKFGGVPYHNKQPFGPEEIQRELYNQLDPTNYLLIRGLATLMKSSMLLDRPEFGEEAFYPLYVSLDASFQLILDALKKQGKNNPNAFDAEHFVAETFGEEASGKQYFEDYYIDRVATVHPKNRYGSFPYAPIMYNDFFGLYKALREIYRYLILGRVEKLDARIVR